MGLLNRMLIILTSYCGLYGSGLSSISLFFLWSLIFPSTQFKSGSSEDSDFGDDIIWAVFNLSSYLSYSNDSDHSNNS